MSYLSSSFSEGFFRVRAGLAGLAGLVLAGLAGLAGLVLAGLAGLAGLVLVAGVLVD